MSLLHTAQQAKHEPTLTLIINRIKLFFAIALVLIFLPLGIWQCIVGTIPIIFTTICFAITAISIGCIANILALTYSKHGERVFLAYMLFAFIGITAGGIATFIPGSFAHFASFGPQVCFISIIMMITSLILIKNFSFANNPEFLLRHTQPRGHALTTTQMPWDLNIINTGSHLHMGTMEAILAMFQDPNTQSTAPPRAPDTSSVRGKKLSEELLKRFVEIKQEDGSPISCAIGRESFKHLKDQDLTIIDPVTLDGMQTYDKSAIEKWVRIHHSDPVTRKEVTMSDYRRLNLADIEALEAKDPTPNVTADGP